jgi:hypothetical protein
MANLSNVVKHRANFDEACVDGHVKALKPRQQTRRSLMHKFGMTDQAIRSPEHLE